MTEVSQLKNDLAQENLKTEDGIMQINQEQGELMKFMVKIAHAKKGIEVGTFTGYSSICFA